MKPATLIVVVGQLALAMATIDPTRYSVLSVLYTAMPSSVRTALAAQATQLNLDDALPADVKDLLFELYPEEHANSAFAHSASATVCKTETLTITQTITVTTHSSSVRTPLPYANAVR